MLNDTTRKQTSKSRIKETLQDTLLGFFNKLLRGKRDIGEPIN